VITGGTVTINAGADAATASDSAKGISAGVVVAIDGGEVSVDAVDDAIHSNGSVGIGGGTVTATSEDDGIHADQRLEIRDGEVTVADSYEGLEGTDIAISGGAVDVTSSDDGVNAAGASAGGEQNTGETLTISGGSVRVVSGGDSLDSNGDIALTGGTTVLSGPSDSGGQGAIDSNGAITIDGGEVLVAGTALVDPTGSQQWVAAMASGAAGDTVTVSDASGTVIATFEAGRDFSAVFYSGPAVTDGGSYTVAVNGTTAATVAEGSNVAGGMGGGPGGGGGRRP